MSETDTDTDLVTPPLSEVEVRRRMPALRYIDDKQIEAEVIHLTKFAPPYFWTRPGATGGYHNAHRHGLWAHTLKLAPVIDRLADSWIEQGHIRESDVDLAHAAGILHDQLKAGEDGGDTESDHDLQMGARIRDHSDLPRSVARAVESHMGSWYDGPKPLPGSLEDLVHTAF